MTYIATPRFPETVSFGATFEPNYSTDVVMVTSGKRYSNARWENQLVRGNMGRRNMRQAQADALGDFFHSVAFGKANSFRVKNPIDYQASVSQGILSVIDVSPPTYQLYKQYSAGASFRNRKITKPVLNTIVFSGGGVYDLDPETGIVSVVSGANPTGWHGEFDIQIAFDTDALPLTIVDKNGSGFIVSCEDMPFSEVDE